MAMEKSRTTACECCGYAACIQLSECCKLATTPALWDAAASCTTVKSMLGLFLMCMRSCAVAAVVIAVAVSTAAASASIMLCPTYWPAELQVCHNHHCLWPKHFFAMSQEVTNTVELTTCSSCAMT